MYVAIRKQNRECAPHITTNAQNLARAIHYPANWDKADGVLVTNERKTHHKKTKHVVVDLVIIKRKQSLLPKIMLAQSIKA